MRIPTLFLLLFFFSSGYLSAQNKHETADTLLSRYLSDTLDAPKKIHELIKRAISHQIHDRSKAILEFQIALALAPYIEDSSQLLSDLYGQFSGVLFDAGATNLGVEYAKKALAYRRTAPDATTVGIYHLLGRIQSYYMRTLQFDSAKVYALLAFSEARKTGAYLWIASAQNNLGYLCQVINEQDSALTYFLSAKNDLKIVTHEDSMLFGSIRDNIAMNEFGKKNFTAALALHHENEAWYNGIGRFDKAVQAQIGVFN
ncbi:MAG: hypothetical protein ABI729_08055 [Chitinophagales bacterium]